MYIHGGALKVLWISSLESHKVIKAFLRALFYEIITMIICLIDCSKKKPAKPPHGSRNVIPQCLTCDGNA